MSYSGASVNSPRLSSEFGSRRSGWDNKGRLVQEDIPLTSQAADVVITLPATKTSGYTLSVQFNRANGEATDTAHRALLYLFKDATPTALADTGGSTGLAADTNHGFIAKTVTAKLIFEVFTDAAGLFTATWTDTAHETCRLGVLLPSGRLVISAPLTTA